MDERKPFRILPKALRINGGADRKRFEIQTPLSKVEPIEQGGQTPRSREELAILVETPLIEACQLFFDKGIETSMSSANKKDVALGEVYIVVRYDTLSKENKEIAERHGGRFTFLNREYIKIIMLVTERTTAQQVSKHMVGVAEQFKLQR